MLPAHVAADDDDDVLVVMMLVKPRLHRSMRSGASPGQKIWGGHAWQARGVRVTGFGSGPQRDPGAEPLVRGHGEIWKYVTQTSK